MQLILEPEPTEGIKINMSMQAETPVSKDIIAIKDGLISDKENKPNIGDGAVDSIEKKFNNKTEINDQTSVPGDNDTNTCGKQAVETLNKIDSNGLYCTQHENEVESTNINVEITTNVHVQKDVVAKIQVTESTDIIHDNVNKDDKLILSEDRSAPKINNGHKIEENGTENITLIATSQGITEISKPITENSQDSESVSYKKIIKEPSAPKLNLQVTPCVSETSIKNNEDNDLSKNSSSTDIEPVKILRNDKIDTDDVEISNMDTNNPSNISEDVATNKQTDELSNHATLDLDPENLGIVVQSDDMSKHHAIHKPSEVLEDIDIDMNQEPNTLVNDKASLSSNSEELKTVHLKESPTAPVIGEILDIKEEYTKVSEGRSDISVSEKSMETSIDISSNVKDTTKRETDEDSETDNNTYQEKVESVVGSTKDCGEKEIINIEIDDVEVVDLDKNKSVENMRVTSLVSGVESFASSTKGCGEKEIINIEIDDVEVVDLDKNKPEANIGATSLVGAVESVTSTTKACGEKEIINMEVDDVEVVDLGGNKSDENIEITSLVSAVNKETKCATIVNPESPSEINENEIERLISEGVKALENEKNDEIVPMETNEVEIVDLEKDNKQDENVSKFGSVSDITKSLSAETKEQQIITPNISDTTDSALSQEKKELKNMTLEEQMEILDEDDIKIVENKQEETSNTKTKTQEKEKSPEPTKTLPVVCKLSNTLDILSDDEEETSKESPKVNNSSEEKQCINIDDDDDIMLIEEEDSNSKDSGKSKKTLIVKETTPKLNEKTDVDPSEKNDTVKDGITESTPINDSLPASPPNIDSVLQTDKTSEREVENTDSTKPLVARNFLKTAKKNIAEMSRHELEDFCILRIVESIVDRSNLSDIKTKIKTMAQSLEDFRKKATTLTKQNRDLQVVLKSVQEEQKKRMNAPIQPLKITRSVGMQVLMNDKVDPRKKGPIPNQQPVAQTASGRPMRAVQAKMAKPPVPPSTIPVPRKVPVNSSPAKTVANSSPVNSATKSPSLNGLRNPSPVHKAPEKRTHSRMQSSSSVTVDLTDDEPPPKINNKNAAVPPVRVVPPQNLLAQQRPFTQPLNNPRKVYIPIGASGQQIRPGQTLMMRNGPSSGPRQRSPAPRLTSSSVRFNRQVPQRHPAPLPDAMKQYTPPTWKALPPAPDLKLSKVENGIVISWKIDAVEADYETIVSYQLYAYQETNAPPNTSLWKKIGDVKALPLPMACTLTQFMAGFKYYFAVRAVDIRSRLGPFSLPGSILLLNKM